MSRESYTLWVGKTDKAMPPPNVKLRILGRYGGRCARCAVDLMTGKRPEFDHVIALEDGGINAEGNFQPLCKPCHGLKTAGENTERAHVRARAKSAYGIKPKGKSFPKRAKPDRPVRDKLPLPGPERGPLYRSIR